MNLHDVEVDEGPLELRWMVEVNKFKQTGPPYALKTSLGPGLLQLLQPKGKPRKDGLRVVAFKNFIGKVLFVGFITGKFSKVRVVEEKTAKYQLKIQVIKHDADPEKRQLSHCFINFIRRTEMDAFLDLFEKAMAGSSIEPDQDQITKHSR